MHSRRSYVDSITQWIVGVRIAKNFQETRHGLESPHSMAVKAILHASR